MPIHTVIREKRKALEMTQEQVAERLGVSASAVNKWERGNTCPHIMILPALARLLETDVNTLLCFKGELTDQEMTRVCEDVVKEIKDSGFGAGFCLAEKRMREYPNCMKLLYSLNVTLEGSFILEQADLSGEEHERYQKKILARYEFVAENAKDEQIRSSAAYMLAGKYIGQGRYERAEELLELMPERSADKRIMKSGILAAQGKRDEAARILEGKILGDINEVHLTLMKLLDIVMDEGDEEDAQKIAKIGQKTAELYELWGYNSILIPMELAVKKQDVRESVKYIREMLNIAKTPWKMPDSPLYRHIDKNDKTEEQGGAESRERQDAKEQYGTRILPVLKKELQTSPRYDFLREDEEFLELIAE